MKRISIFLLSLILITSLCACGAEPDSSRISFAREDFSPVNSAVLRNLYNGKGTYISDPEDIQALCAFLRSVNGVNAQSAQGYYEGSYSLTLYASKSPTQAVLKEETPLFSIVFGDSSTFHYGIGEDGYPIRYELKGISIDEVIETLAAFDIS